jgi:hypothetical protein
VTEHSPPAPTALAASEGRQPAAPVPAEVRLLLGPPPLAHFEDEDAFAQLEAALAAHVRPRDVIEWLRVRDIATLVFEAQRLRRAKAAMLALARRNGLKLIFTLTASRHDRQHGWPEEAAAAYLQGDEKAIARFRHILATTGLPASVIDDAAVQAALEDFERLERLIAQADARRDAALRELQRSRDAAERRLAAAAEVVDAEFEA